jgi:hypothetical protein
MTKEEFDKSKPKFKVGEIVKQSPTGLVKRVASIDMTRVPDGTMPDKYSYHHIYYLDDSFGYEYEFSLSKTEEAKVSLSAERSAYINNEKLKTCLQLLKELDADFDTQEHSYIGRDSDFHKRIKEILNQAQ